MERRNFLTSLAGFFALPFIPKAEAKAEPDRYSYGLCKINPDGSVENMTDKEADESHADFMKDYPPTARTYWQEWPNDGHGPIIHHSDPAKINGSFVVKMNVMDFKTN